MTAKTATTPTPELIVPGNLVDDYGDLSAKRDAFAPTDRAHRKVFEQLKALVADADPAAQFTVRGERYVLTISARSIQRKVDLAKVKKLLGAAQFLEAATVTLTALANWLTAPQIETVTYAEQSGSRSFDAVPIKTDG